MAMSKVGAPSSGVGHKMATLVDTSGTTLVGKVGGHLWRHQLSQPDLDKVGDARLGKNVISLPAGFWDSASHARRSPGETLPKY